MQLMHTHSLNHYRENRSGHLRKEADDAWAKAETIMQDKKDAETRAEAVSVMK